MKKMKRYLSILITMILSVIFIGCGFQHRKSDTYISDLKVHFIDVGQADSILIQQGNENMLIDAGNNDDEETLKNYLNKLGIKKFTYVVGTHAHEDHIGSLDYIINSYEIGRVYFPKISAATKTFENVVKAVKNKDMKFTVPSVGDTFNIGDAKCTVLAPNSSKYEDANNYSIVIKLEYKNTSFIFTGDAEDVSEKEMLDKGLDLRADVLKAGHHGSSSSSTNEFLDAVNPKYAVISVGKDNDYGHPNKETLDKLNARKIKVYRTDESGTIIAESDGDNIVFSAEPSKISSEGKKNSTTNSSGSESKEDDKNIESKKETKNISKADSSDNNKVYVSKNKGKVYHYDKTCSSLNDPDEYTLKEAEAKGLKPCSKCVK
ncbi:MAG: ComEC/Rec2 family competence protein [Clostridium sp.]